jgi:hypothetical protein
VPDPNHNALPMATPQSAPENVETIEERQAEFLRRRFSVCYSLAASLASLVYGLGPK